MGVRTQSEPTQGWGGFHIPVLSGRFLFSDNNVVFAAAGSGEVLSNMGFVRALAPCLAIIPFPMGSGVRLREQKVCVF